MSDAELDKHGRLDDEPFTYTINKQGLVFIAWHGKSVLTLKGDAADKFLARAAGASEKDAQLVMAKLTGNFKHGNEKMPKRR